MKGVIGTPPGARGPAPPLFPPARGAWGTPGGPPGPRVERRILASLAGRHPERAPLGGISGRGDAHDSGPRSLAAELLRDDGTLPRPAVTTRRGVAIPCSRAWARGWMPRFRRRC